MERSSREPVTRPTGAAMFCSCSAWTTCATLTPAACRSLGRTCTVSSRSCLPNTVTSATPGMERSWLVIPGSTRRVSCAGESADDETASDTIGVSVSFSFLTIGSSSSGGRSLRTLEIASRTSCVASLRFLPNSNSMMKSA